MGKQINFYMGKSTQETFIDYLCQNSFLFLDKQAADIGEIITDNIFSVYLYKYNYGNIIMRQDSTNSIDSLKSPVIQLKKQ